LDGFKPIVVDIAGGASANDLWIHDETDRVKATILTRFFDNPVMENHLPRPFGIFYTEERGTYEDGVNEQIERAQQKGLGDLDKLLKGRETWMVG